MKNYSSELLEVESIEYNERTKCYIIKFKFDNMIRGREFFFIFWNNLHNLCIWEYLTDIHFNVAVTTTHRIEKNGISIHYIDLQQLT